MWKYLEILELQMSLVKVMFYCIKFLVLIFVNDDILVVVKISMFFDGYIFFYKGFFSIDMFIVFKRSDRFVFVVLVNNILCGISDLSLLEFFVEIVLQSF